MFQPSEQVKDMACSERSKKLCGEVTCEVCVPRSFAGHPHAAEWSPKNQMKPHQVLKSSGESYWFDCKGCGHSILLKLARVSAGKWCSHCNSGKLCEDDACAFCRKKSMASHPMGELWSARNKKLARQVSRGNGDKFWFKCKTCLHEFLKTPASMKEEKLYCAYCAHQTLCDDDCKFCFELSCANHPRMAAEWSLDNEKTARQVFLQSNAPIRFKCQKCDHTFDTNPSDYTRSSRSDNNGCPYCDHKKLCKLEDCIRCLNNSCASDSRLVADWNTPTIKPRQVFKHTHVEYHFKCRACDHAYVRPPHSGCPYCADVELCGAKECKICFEKSFASHPRIACWSPKNTLNPRMTFKGSDQRAIFQCDTCSIEYTPQLCNVLSGFWCGCDKRKSELKVLAFLQEAHPACRTEIRYDWCRFSETNNMMPFDFGLEDAKVLIELDGDQHFKDVANWGATERTQVRDIEKIRYAVEKGYTVIHIYQVEVWKDEYDWRAALSEQIKRVESQGAQGGKVIFIGRKEVYGKHIEGLDGIAYEVVRP